MTPRLRVLARIDDARIRSALPHDVDWVGTVGAEPVDGVVLVGTDRLGEVPDAMAVLLIASGEPPLRVGPFVSVVPDGPWLRCALVQWLARLSRDRALELAIRHDLFGPLTVVSGHIDLLEEFSVNQLSARQLASIETMRRGVDRLTRQIEALGDGVPAIAWPAGSGCTRLSESGEAKA